MKLLDEKILNDSQIEFFIDNNDYSSAAEYLFNSQLKSWTLLKNNYEALKNVHLKSFWYEGFKIKVQFNLERIKSTSAKVDEDSIKNRKCFLCVENLPDEQKGLLLPDDFMLLCNPYPIFPQHFTICSVEHKPQRISKAFGELLEMTKLLSPKYSLIYNGPSCGASAPDHFHFQAGSKNFIPIENDIQQMKNDCGSIVQEEELITTSFINDGLRKIIFIESTDKSEIEKTFRVIYKVYEKLSSNTQEPMLNIVSAYDLAFGWSVIIFLRSKHRPEVFYKNEPDKLLISPAAIDLGGVVVTPREEDFHKIDKEILGQIFNEVSLDKTTFSRIEEKLKQKLN
ncbi:MAG: DUF4922 domain-containing protein [bacterium]|nr:DUF4922 domain-containing protein [bacterium]